MENKCKNCISFWPVTHHGDGSKGTCSKCGELIIHSREDDCDCGGFIEMPKVPRLKSRIENRLYPWIRERDDMFRRSMEIVSHICHLFNLGEFKVFDAAKSASEMKGIVFMGRDVETAISNIWTYHCPWNDDIEHFIAITANGKLVTNTYNDMEKPAKFVTECYDIENDFDTCNDVIDRIMLNCRMKICVSPMPKEVECNKCVYDKEDIIK
jgi:hypothetical protein